MKISTKGLLMVLGILTIVFVTLQWTKRKGKSKTLRSELVVVDTAKVSNILIRSLKETVELNKTEQGWEVAIEAGSKPVKNNTVESMLATLSTIQPDRLVARKSNKWQDYGVDSTGTRVQIYDGEQIMTDIILGQFGVEGQQKFYTYVRLFEDDNVYAAKNFMKMSIYQSPNDYRDNTVLQLKKDSLVSIDFQYPDSSFVLTKRKDDWFIDNALADSTAIAQFIQNLNFISNKSFHDEAIPSNATHKVIFLFSNQPEITVEGYTLEDGFVIRSSENEVESFNDETVRNRIFKGKSNFIITE